MSHKLVCIVGMCGAGKSELAEFFKSQGFLYIRFGQITIDEVKRRGLEVNEKNEKAVREDFRREHGMAAYAILNIPRFDEGLKKGHVIGDGLYSWDEYKVLKDKYAKDLAVISIYASPETRYARLTSRGQRHGSDEKKIFRSLTLAEAKKRDVSEIENLDKGGPIAMADYTLVNEGSLAELKAQAQKVLDNISKSDT